MSNGKVPPGWYEYDGGQRYWDGEQWTEHRAEPPKKKGGRLWLWIVVVALAIGVLTALGGGDEDGDEEPEPAVQESSGPSANEIRIGAELVCEDEVRSQLKAPDTAEFSDTEAVKTKGSKYAVKGAVDSENSFGANLRAYWVCDAEHIRGNRYRVDATVLE